MPPRPKIKLVWTIWPSARDVAAGRTGRVAPWSAVVEARYPGAVELAGHDAHFYTGPVAVAPSRGWVFRSFAAALRAYRRPVSPS